MPSPRPLLALAALLPALTTAAAQSAQAPRFEFTIANMMRGPELYGREPQDVRWSPDGRWVYFRWNEAGADWREPLRLYRVRAQAGARPERVPDAQADSVLPLVADGSWARDRRFRVVAHDGDLWRVDAGAAAARRLTRTLAAESQPQVAADGKRVFFVRDNNVFALELAGGFVQQLTDVRPGPQPDSARAGAQRRALEADQRALFDVIRDRVARDSVQAAERKAREALRPTPLWLNANERVLQFAVAPGGDALVLTTSTAAPRARTAQVPDWVTKSGYVEELPTRTKVGDEQATGRVAYVRVPTGAARWLKVLPSDTVRAPASVQLLGWNDAGTAALVRAERRDFKERVLSAVGDSGAVRTVDVLRDSAWVAGPCASCAGWLPDGKVWFVSEADGWAHLYTVGADGAGKRQLTQGKFEVLQAELSPDRSQFRLHTSERSVFDRDFYTMPVAGGARTRLTRDAGGHQVEPSPDGRMLADVYSTANRPPELFVQAARADAPRAQLTTSPTADWLGFAWKAPEIVMVPGSDGVQVPARVYRPQDVGAQPNGAAAIFVHGAGYLHNVHNWWSSYSREYMFHHYLASKGYVVLDIDYRGSAGYGRDWRTAIYRHMGGRDLQDHVDGVRWLQKTHGVDPERVGIYGGSYGGFITLMALFTEPKMFGAGAALRAVTDWAHYNHPYTGRILNFPEGDTTAYRRSSPIFFAQGLEDPLLMAHGMVDVNVHYQDIVRLTQRLIELGKTDWELASYPVEDHGFVRPSSWADEYRRIFELFERTIGRRPIPAATSGSGPR
ncbi:prolyl oligopeptidase family serine peptidase [Roseisolibacter sp. H3M3-2]|uniref:S9 family peptidase n=1 Tax=Roseisolibacter sp. H3M3-2 TaxID=3031323 RepID=UPI0023DB5DDF|nr:prolyl oligopeptidase family serine peptidase [Roseisolibacter sp. H3M3-2]MDF1502469.1 prolyl oligopeptidase family serine peptidase [Roseisolibacter sp. H3M3-2]